MTSRVSLTGNIFNALLSICLSRPPFSSTIYVYQRLKTSLLTEDGDTAAQAHQAHPVARAQQNGARTDRAGGGEAVPKGPGDGMGRGRGLWDDAAAGDLDAIAAALSPGGDGDVNARNTDGEEDERTPRCIHTETNSQREEDQAQKRQEIDV